MRSPMREGYFLQNSSNDLVDFLIEVFFYGCAKGILHFDTGTIFILKPSFFMVRSSLFVTFYTSYCTKNILFYAVQRIYCIKSEFIAQHLSYCT